MDSKNDEQVEQWLDAALNTYSTVEPRAGLEKRVLANLQSERQRMVAQRRRWWAAGIATAAVAIVMAAWVGESGSRRDSARALGNTTSQHATAAAPREPVPAPATHSVRQIARRPDRQSTRTVALVTPPKLEQFPSPAPLNEQEQLLMRYVQESPRRAALVARAQTDLRKQNEREMAGPWPQTGVPTTLDQQE